MAAAVQVHGLATIQVNVGEGSTLATLGYTENGAFINFTGYYQQVPGDENGGDDGPPIELNYMGETANVRLELSKWDLAVAKMIVCRNKGGAEGAPNSAGTLVFTNTKHYRLVVNSPTEPFDFPRAVPNQPYEINKGTKYARLVMEWTCYKDPTSGLLYDTTA